MDKSKAIELAGGPAALAKIFGITVSAVSQWDEIPAARVWELRAKRPEWFQTEASSPSDKAA